MVLVNRCLGTTVTTGDNVNLAYHPDSKVLAVGTKVAFIIHSLCFSGILTARRMIGSTLSTHAIPVQSSKLTKKAHRLIR